MANVKYFHGDIQLVRVHQIAHGYGEHPADVAPVWNPALKKHERTLLKVERTVTYKSNPSRHQCDARCYNARGRTMNCECACGGRNHGKGSVGGKLVCEVTA